MVMSKGGEVKIRGFFVVFEGLFFVVILGIFVVGFVFWVVVLDFRGFVF